MNFSKKLFNGMKNVNSLTGKPYIIYTKANVVVFCDGDFWHGRVIGMFCGRNSQKAPMQAIG